MCGRFEIHSPLEIILKIFAITGGDVAYVPSYNIAPTHDVLIALDTGTRTLARSRWGFLPAWARDASEGARMINARAETVAGKPSFREAFARQRCLVLADGFYEWKREEKTRKPYLIRLKNGEPFAMAGLYNVWRSPEGREVLTNAIITTEADELVRPIHDRMPAILAPDAYGAWLDPENHDKAALLALLKPWPSDELERYAVSPTVNSPATNAPENIQRIP
jgi:putative SOS response-associated peptidase YedK